MSYSLAKNLSHCLQTAVEAQDFLNKGEAHRCQALLQKLITGLDGCIDQTLREAVPSPIGPTGGRKLEGDWTKQLR